ncbi:MAG: hypothetical protein GDA36_05795 [Rhodobacteraceae bacterium]|nr:hypothetical protein [Paracoccaceae bacterium]
MKKFLPMISIVFATSVSGTAQTDLELEVEKNAEGLIATFREIEEICKQPDNKMACRAMEPEIRVNLYSPIVAACALPDITSYANPHADA